MRALFLLALTCTVLLPCAWGTTGSSDPKLWANSVMPAFVPGAVDTACSFGLTRRALCEQRKPRLPHTDRAAQCFGARSLASSAGEGAGESKIRLEGAVTRYRIRCGTVDDLDVLTELSLEAFKGDNDSFLTRMLGQFGLPFQSSDRRESIRAGLCARLGALHDAADVHEHGAAHDEASDEGNEDKVGSAQYTVLVAEAEDGGDVVGMVELGVLPCPVPLSRRPPPDTPYLVNLAVSRTHRRRGLARALVDACEAIAVEEWGFSEMFLHVNVRNRPAQRLYTLQGFLCELREPNLYQLKSGERRVRMNPRLFMRKELLTHAEGGVEGKGAGELGRSGLFPQTVELRGAPPRGPGEG